MKNKKQGFTLIELLVVITIIAILVAVIFVALNPLELFAKSRNAQRWVKTSELLTAIHLYIVQHDGTVPNEDDWQQDVYYDLGTGGTCLSTCAAVPVMNDCLNLTDLTADNKIASIPRDPQTGTTANTQFWVKRSSSTVVTVGICDPELDENIQLTR